MAEHDPSEAERRVTADQTLNEREPAQAKKGGAVMDDVRLIKDLLDDHDRREGRNRLDAALDCLLDWRHGKRSCVGDRLRGRLL